MNTAKKSHSRRDFVRNVGLGSLVLAMANGASEAAARRLKFGHTFITWGYDADVLEPAVKAISE